jgi:putative ABC transport system substrate-binding protein
VDFAAMAVSGLASMYPAFDWSVVLLAIMDISARVLVFGAPCQLLSLAGQEHGRTIPLADTSCRFFHDAAHRSRSNLCYTPFTSHPWAEKLMRRREFILFSVVPLAWPVAALAQTVNAVRRIGFLGNWAEKDVEGAKRLAVFKLRLQELGWTEGNNLQIDVRFAYNSGERLREAATELIELAPDGIISTTSTTTNALMNATGNIPIVAAVSGDPVALGFTKSLSHPTRNITGFTTFNDILAAKRFEMLQEIVPKMRTAALMWVPINPQQVLLEAQTKEAARTLGIELLSLPIKAANDISPALAMAQNKQASAIIVAADPLTVANGRAIIDECISMKMLAIHTFASETKLGALMSYGIDVLESYRRTAEYADRILKGTKVAVLPFQEPSRFTLAINLQTARAIGVKVPSTLLALADEVIE